MMHYCLKCGTEMDESSLICPSCSHCSYMDELSRDTVSIAGILTARQLEANTQWTKYKCGPNGLCGHGYAAEDANAMVDIFLGKDVEFSGRDNSLSGPDRIVEGQQIQTKYCQTATKSVEAGFGADGMFKYKGQVLEVPADQYDEAVSLMRQKISEGKVEGISDPNDASKVVKRGSVTYRQAKNIARAGNIDSLLFDVNQQTVTAVSAFGISFAINLGMLLIFRTKNKTDVKEAMQVAFLNGLQNGTITLASGILSSQVLRTQFGRNFAAGMQWMSKNGVDYVYKTEAGRKLIHQMVKALFGKEIYGAAAKNVATKFLRTNAITNTALLVVTSLPDAWHLVAGQITGPQFFKNLFVTGCSITGAGSGALLGAKVGAGAGPAGMAGGMIGGLALGWASRKVADMIRKDDAERLLPLIQVAIVQLSHDYMIQTEEEFAYCTNLIANEGVISTSLFHRMQKCGNDFERVHVAMDAFDYYFSVTIRQRKKVLLAHNQQLMLDSINEIGEALSVSELSLPHA